MPTIISLLNFKGGVGKTSLTVNLAATLAASGRRVLVVDLDPQSNTSVWLLRLDRWNQLHRDNAKFTLSLFEGLGTPLPDLIQKDAVRADDGSPLIPGLDLVPASFSLMDLEHDTDLSSGPPWCTRLHLALSEHATTYDFVLLDCPPNFLRGTRAAIFASQCILVPANPDGLSVLGLHLLGRKLSGFLRETESERLALGAPTAAIGGVVLNNVKAGANHELPRRLLATKLNAIRSLNIVAKDAGVLGEEIRSATIVGRAATAGRPLPLLSKSDGADGVAEDYRRLAARVQEWAAPTADPALARIEPPAAEPAPERPELPIAHETARPAELPQAESPEPATIPTPTASSAREEQETVPETADTSASELSSAPVADVDEAVLAVQAAIAASHVSAGAKE